MSRDQLEQHSSSSSSRPVPSLSNQESESSMGLPEDEASMDIPVPLPSRPTSFPRLNYITCILILLCLDYCCVAVLLCRVYSLSHQWPFFTLYAVWEGNSEYSNLVSDQLWLQWVFFSLHCSIMCEHLICKASLSELNEWSCPCACVQIESWN